MSVEPATICFTSLVSSRQAGRRLRLMIDSLRAFGGSFGQCPLWVFWGSGYRPTELMSLYPEKSGVAWFQLADEDRLPDYYFTHKVKACAQAEEMVSKEIRSLVWLDPNCLVIRPPAFFDLSPAYAAAFRPVHIQNVGSRADQPMDAFWSTIYRAIDIPEAPFTIQSFVDSQTLRPYFNTHLFSIDPSKGLLRAWQEFFIRLVADRQFQSGACSSEMHQIFLHQAVLSVLAAKMLPEQSIRMLPPEYSYPLHLNAKIPHSRRIGCLNELVCAVYEEQIPHVESLGEFEIREPLYSWLRKEQTA